MVSSFPSRSSCRSLIRDTSESTSFTCTRYPLAKHNRYKKQVELPWITCYQNMATNRHHNIARASNSVEQRRFYRLFPSPDNLGQNHWMQGARTQGTRWGVQYCKTLTPHAYHATFTFYGMSEESESGRYCRDPSCIPCRLQRCCCPSPFRSWCSASRPRSAAVMLLKPCAWSGPTDVPVGGMVKRWSLNLSLPGPSWSMDARILTRHFLLSDHQSPRS